MNDVQVTTIFVPFTNLDFTRSNSKVTLSWYKGNSILSSLHSTLFYVSHFFGEVVASEVLAKEHCRTHKKQNAFYIRKVKVDIWLIRPRKLMQNLVVESGGEWSSLGGRWAGYKQNTLCCVCSHTAGHWTPDACKSTRRLPRETLMSPVLYVAEELCDSVSSWLFLLLMSYRVGLLVRSWVTSPTYKGFGKWSLQLSIEGMALCPLGGWRAEWPS